MNGIRNITEKEGDEEDLIAAHEWGQLQEKLKLLNWAVESSNIALVTMDFEGNLKYVNPVVPKMWGYEAEELLEQPASWFWKYPSEVMKAGDECRVRGEWVGELVARRKNGTFFDAHLSFNILRDGDGKAIGFVGSLFDITDRRRAEYELNKRTEELSLAKQRLDMALDAAGMGTWEWDFLSGRITWDDSLFRLSGISKEEFLNTYEDFLEHFNRALPPEDNLRMLKKLQDVVDGKTDNYDFEHDLLYPDGTIRHFLGKGKAQRSPEGKLLSLIGITIDITKQKIAEDALRRSESNLARAQAMAHLGSYSFDIQKGDILWSEGLKAICGYEPDQMLSLEIAASRIHPDDRKRILEALQTAVKEKHQFNYEYRIVRPDGAVRYVHDRGEISHDENENPAWMFGTLQDITDRKLIEEQLFKAKEAAEIANRAKGDFLANVSHEIRTPMNAVLGMLDLLLETDIDNEQREYLQLAHVSAESLLSTIDEVLDFSKIEQNKIELEQIDFNLKSLISYIINLLSGKTGSNGLKLAYYIEEDLPSSFVGDPVRLKQVLFNLLGNAIKFTKEGEVALSVEKYIPSDRGYLSPNSNEGEEMSLLFKVRDTGIGIPSENIDKIFNAFTQVDASVTRKYGGTGLGLAISSQLVELMGGRIWVESEVGKGSTFYFTARVKRGSNEEYHEQESRFLENLIKLKENNELDGSEISSGKSLNILLAEDHPINQKLILSLLKKKGHNLSLVTNGKDVLDILSIRDFDAVLMDVQMPDIDGLEATRKIRDPSSNVRWHEIPIIALTAGVLIEDYDKCIEAGMNYYISKPLKKEKLFKVLDSIRPREITLETTASGGRSEFSHSGEKKISACEEKVSSNITGNSSDGKSITSDFSEDQVFNLEELLERTEGDELLLKEMVGLFLDMFPGLLDSIDKAIKKGETEELRQSAHTLKSAAGSIGANRVFRAAYELEQAGRENELGSAIMKFRELKIRLEEIEPVLIRHMENWIS